MEGFVGFLFFCIIIGIIVYYANKNKQEKLQKETKANEIAEEKKQNELNALQIKWEEKKKDIETNGLPILSLETLQLTKNEVCHFAGDAYFCKIKQETVGYEYGSRGVSFRLMKGVSFRVGNHKGHHIKQEIIDKTDGLIYLTNKKIIFTAIKNSSVIKYKDIINLSATDNMLQLQTEKKTYLFQVVDSLTFMVILEHIINKQNEENAE